MTANQGAAFRMLGHTEDPDVARLWDYGCTGMLEDGDEIVAYFAAPFALPFDGTWETVGETDWVADYYRTLQPVVIGWLVVVPTHHTVTLGAPQRPLWLDPGMAFGSGHHETTSLALGALEQTPLRGLRVLDVGAGSGVLAIAADLLGAADAEGLDIDPATVPVAAANAALNFSRAHFSVGTLGDGVAPADVIVANLFAELHAELAPAYFAALKPGGWLFATGILADREQVARDALNALFGDLEAHTEGEWVLFKVQKPMQNPAQERT